jgi:hypothetical protein
VQNEAIPKTLNPHTGRKAGQYMVMILEYCHSCVMRLKSAVKVHGQVQEERTFSQLDFAYLWIRYKIVHYKYTYHEVL